MALVSRLLAGIGLCLFVAAGMTGVMGCDSNGSSSTTTASAGTGTGVPATDTLTTQSSINTVSFSVAGQALAQAQANVSALTKSAAITAIEYDCTPSGTASITGDVSEDSENAFSMDLDIEFTDCGGLNGTLNETADLTITGSDLSYSFGLTGEVGGNGCVVTYDAFTLNIDFVSSSLSYVVDGDLTSTCDGSTVTCSWNNVNVLTDSSTYAAGCTES